MHSQDKVPKEFFEVNHNSKEGRKNDKLEISLLWMRGISKDEWEDENRFEVEEWNASKDLRVWIKDLDPFLFLKIISAFLSSHSFLRSWTLYLKYAIFFLDL